MKKGIIVNLKQFKILDYVTQNKIFILLASSYILGIFVSAILLSEDNTVIKNAESYLSDYISLHLSCSFFNKFLKTFIRYLIILILYFISGTSMFGVILTPFLTLWQGILFGALSSCIYDIHGIIGIAFNAILIVPPSIFFVVICFFAAKYSLEFSMSIVRLTLPHSRPINLYNSFKFLLSKYVIFIVLILICTTLEIILNLLFLKFFNI